ncbi:MAG: biopolymer transporter ExbD [Candidatus Omnitrophica bacterium]|nr:biopolymer transporter ExbD [Candidatus Omnitrophota bacterium]
MKFQKHYEIIKGEINFIPLVNIVLLIMIYFIMMTGFIAQPVLNIKVSKIAQVKKWTNKIFLDVSSTGRISSEGKEIPLEAVGSFLKNFKGKTLVIVKGQNSTPNGIMVKVIDMVHKSGINNIAISTL